MPTQHRLRSWGVAACRAYDDATACLQNRAAAIALAKSQVDYALGSAGRSYVVGWGTNPPLRVGLPAWRLLRLPGPTGWAVDG